MSLDRKVIPGVQEIMGLQSDPRNLGILRMLQVLGPQTLSSQTSFFRNNGVDLTSMQLVLLNKDLEAELLLKRPRKGHIAPTDLGNTSVDAFCEYRSVLLPLINEARDRRLVSEFGQEEGQRLANLYPAEEQAFGMEPQLLAIMKRQSHEDSMRVLLLLEHGQDMQFKDLRDQAVGIPSSSLSNIGKALERASLIERNSGYKATELGVLAVDAYFSYQTRVLPELIGATVEQIKNDSIKLPAGITL